MGQDKTLEIIYRNFFEPEMEEEINNYMRSCLVYQRMKYPGMQGMAFYTLLNSHMLYGSLSP
jgi:hypothetical protein